jgi:hypothetical protein
MPFTAPDIMELWPRSSAARREHLRLIRDWTPEHRINVGLTMSSLLGTGMKLEIAREHPDWPARKVGLEVGRLTWGWEIAPPLYGPLEEEAQARGESPSRRAEFLARWRLELPDEPIVLGGHRKRNPEEMRHSLDRWLSEEPCG